MYLLQSNKEGKGDHEILAIFLPSQQRTLNSGL